MSSLETHRRHYQTHSKEELIEAVAQLHVTNEVMALAALQRSKLPIVSWEVRNTPFEGRPDSGWMKTSEEGFRQAVMDNAAASTARLPVPWQYRALSTSASGVVTQLDLGIEQDIPAPLVVDFNEDVDLGPVPISEGRSSVNVKVSFDGAEGQGRVWLMDSDDNWVAIEGRDHARTLAGLLNAWADAYPEGDLP